MSLDTKYRPRNFNDVLGQESTIAILRRYISSGRGLHQSYLFAGAWGSGKTTLGRIMARALMCQSPTAEGDPCDACPSCTSILETGASMDFVEVDAATNSGKADVQKITEEIQYSTYAGRRRIYLFDEAHQLSKDALDALLKPLEEVIPGTQEKRLVCIFCTTEPEKMKATIFSRCAPTFVIQPVSPPQIAKRLAWVCEQEGFEYELDMLQVVAELTECHIRDALKAVEGVSLLGPLNRDNITSYLKLDSNGLFVGILENLGKDMTAVMSLAKQVLERSSPATCYEKLAHMAMLAYQVHLGASKSPSYIEAGRLEALGQSQNQNLIGFATRLSGRPGRPTEAMLFCDLGSMHYSGGSQLGDSSVVVVQNTAPSFSRETLPRETISPGNTVSPSLSPSDSGTLKTSPIGKGAQVRANPKAVGGGPLAASVLAGPTKGKVSEVDLTTFCYLLAMELANSEGAVGSAGRSNLDRH